MLKQLAMYPKINELHISLHEQACMTGDTKKGNVNILFVF